MKKILLLSSLLAVLSTASSFAMDIYTVPANKPAFLFNIYNQDETIRDESGNVETSEFTLSENQRDALFDAAANWNFIINNNYTYDPDKLPNFVVLTKEFFNANAGSSYVDVGEDYLITEINAYINKKIPTSPSDIHGVITVGLGLHKDYPGWNHYAGPTVLYQAEKPDLYSTMAHEIYHAMGLITNAGQHIKGDESYYFSKDSNSKISIWDSGLRVYQAPIDTTPFDSSKILAADKGMSVKIDKDGSETFDIVNYSPYFTGKNTLQVLTGNNSTDEEYLQELIYNNGGMKNYSEYYDPEDNPAWSNKVPLVLGLPVHVIEDGKPELSHIELRNSFMSHQPYQNWSILMEAELAVLKDLGYTNVQLRDFFGKSYYLNNIADTFSTGYGEWNGLNYSGYSQIANGIGLHIYGNNNNITQNNNTLSDGKYTIGTRIDGVNNTYTLNNSIIDVRGGESIGVAVTWGKGHTVNIDNSSSVHALGKDSIGVSFDFGKNVCGGLGDDRGSYSSYELFSKKNTTPDVETQGALVDNFNVDGKVFGDKAAIYISENALVNNININNNAEIHGDIISQWNSVKSGINMYVARKGTDGKWYPVDQDKTEEIYFTNLNFSGNTLVDGNIDGSNDIFNTLDMKNNGNLYFYGKDMNIYHLKNTGIINFLNATNSPELSVQDGSVSGSGTLNFTNGINLAGVNNIENTVNIDDTFISLSDGKAETINIFKLNADGAKLYIDYGDKFVLQNNSDPGLNSLNLEQIAVNQANADSLDETESVQIFEAASPTALPKTLDVGSSANFYYNKNKYTFTQSTSDKSVLSIDKTTGNFGLSDAIADSSTANYIVTEDETVTNDLGTVSGDYFEISGDELDVAGHTGLVVDGSSNGKTVLKTDIFGASDSNITLLNEANFVVEAKEDIDIGKSGETSLTIDNSTFEADLEGNSLNIAGSIKGLNANTKNFVILSAKNINLDSADNVVLATKSETANLKNTLTDTIWQIESMYTNVYDDSYLSSNGTNSIVHKGGVLNIQNDKASDINLLSMRLDSDLSTAVDVDLGSLSADKFVFNDPDNLITNGFSINIADLNIMNQNSALTKENYYIPFVSPEYNNQHFYHGVYMEDRNVLTPIFKYNLSYAENETQGAFELSRGSSGDFRSYNNAILASPIAAQLGGYLIQLNSYDQAFMNMDTYMMMPSQVRTAMKMRNKIASLQNAQYDDTKTMYDYNAGWFRPYATFETVALHNGPNVRNNMYGSFFGGESSLKDLGHGWDGMWGAYVGYNGSHQSYDSVGIYQNGGTLGLTGMAYKNNFFVGGTVNVGASGVESSTMYGNDDFAMLMTGAALKTGYNWELARGKFIIQPSLITSYSFVNTFNYRNAAGVANESDPLHAIQIEPGIKFIGNLKNGWQPYAGVSMVFNIMDRTRFQANDISLPNFSVNPFVKYGIGVRKTWGERLTGHFQTYFTNGGRNGIGLQAGLRWAIGKKGTSEIKGQTPELKPAKVTLNNHKG